MESLLNLSHRDLSKLEGIYFYKKIPIEINVKNKFAFAFSFIRTIWN